MKPVLLLLLCLFFPLPAAGDDAAALDEIDKLVRLRDYPRVVVQLQVLAQNGSAEAQFRLAGLYRSGKGVRPNLAKARELYLDAALAGHAQAQFVLALLLEKSHDPTAATEARKWYRMAAAQGHERAATRLEQLRAEPASVSLDIEPDEIFSAIQHNDGMLIDALISRGADLDLTDTHGNTPVLAALLAGWPQLAVRLIPQTRHPGRANLNGILPLQLASGRGYGNFVRALLDSGVDIDQLDTRGNSALMVAIESGYAEIAGLLLERGANPRLTNNKKQSALDIGLAVDNRQAVALLGRYGLKPTPPARPASAIDLAGFRSALDKSGSRYAGWPLLNVAIELGEQRVASQIIAQGPDLAATDAEGNSALQVAARKSDAAQLRQLLLLGADVNAVNDNNETALHHAVAAKCLKCVKLLVEHRADASIESVNGVTALELAFQTGQTDVALLLLADGSDYAGIHHVLVMAVQKKNDKLASELVERDSRLAATDANGRTVLWHSADLGLEKTTAALLDTGKIDLDQQDKDGRGAISQAAARGHIRIVRMLADKGADLGLCSAAGNSLLMLAVLAEDPEIVDFLLTRRVDVNARNKLGNTALMLAAARAQDHVIERLIAAGADLQLRNREDLNAFQIANDAGHAVTAQLIHDRSNLMFKLFN